MNESLGGPSRAFAQCAYPTTFDTHLRGRIACQTIRSNHRNPKARITEKEVIDNANNALHKSVLHPRLGHIQLLCWQKTLIDILRRVQRINPTVATGLPKQSSRENEGATSPYDVIPQDDSFIRILANGRIAHYFQDAVVPKVKRIHYCRRC